jgi:ribonuclease HII
MNGLGIKPNDIVIGIDEVGRGSLMGDVVVCGAMATCDKISGVTDSKAMSEHQRSAIMQEVMGQKIPFAIAYADNHEIDQKNVLHATMLAMERVSTVILSKITNSQPASFSHTMSNIQEAKYSPSHHERISTTNPNQLVEVHGEWSPLLPPESTPKGNNAQNFKADRRIFILIDGSHIFLSKINQLATIIPIPKGDSKVYEIGLASIIAKATRDGYVKDVLHTQFTNYKWDKNLGYGTKEHIDAIAKFGTTPLHRKSFKVSQKGSDCMEKCAKVAQDSSHNMTLI